VSVGQAVFFVARDRDHDSELWAIEAGARNARRLTELGPREPFGLELRSGELGGKLLFLVEIAGWELWESDGTADGTRRVSRLVATPGTSSP
jgi:ELWxxDGT repeat protein